MPQELVNLLHETSPNGHSPLRPEVLELLRHIQGNILVGHRRGHALHLLMRMHQSDLARRRAIKWITGLRVSSAAEQDQHGRPGAERPFVMLALSRWGYEALGVPQESWPGDHAFRQGMPETRVASPMDEAARDSYRRLESVYKSEPRLGALLILAHDDRTSLLRWWEAMAPTVAEFADVVKEDGAMLWRHKEGAGADQHIRLGVPPPLSDIHFVEHFGYADGLSQPQFFADRVARARARRASGSAEDSAGVRRGRGDAAARLDLALTDSLGSYLVFRKLEQDVPGFLANVCHLAQRLAVAFAALRLHMEPRAFVDDPGLNAFATSFRTYDAVERELEAMHRSGGGAFLAAVNNSELFRRRGKLFFERAGAMMIGRFNDGRPLITPDAGPELNDFNWREADPEGRICPFHAHARRMNPRGEFSYSPSEVLGTSDPGTRRLAPDHRIVRRGIPYGEPFRSGRFWSDEDIFNIRVCGDYSSLRDNTERGLLFMSFQARLDNFEALQQASEERDYVPESYARSVGRLPRQVRGSDPFSTRWRDSAADVQYWPCLTDPGTAEPSPSWPYVPCAAGRFVTLRGGEYFYAPSLQELKTIRRLVH